MKDLINGRFPYAFAEIEDDLHMPAGEYGVVELDMCIRLESVVALYIRP
jgi:hypothetical protein